MDTVAAAQFAFLPSEPEVVLRLREGTSTWSSWPFVEGDRGMRIVIGSHASCNWQIQAVGVHDQELEVVFTGRALLVRSLRPGCGTRLNGFALGSGWIPVEDGSGLDVGFASIEVGIRTEQGDDWEAARERAKQLFLGAEEAPMECGRHPEAVDAQAQTPGGSYLFDEVPRLRRATPLQLAYGLLLVAAYATWVMLLDRV